MTSPDRPLAGKTALVTGGGIGIGREIAAELARCGAQVALTYLTHSPEQEFLESLDHDGAGPALAMQVDVTDPGAVAAAVQRAGEHLGGLDILINNAGGLIGREPLATMSDDHWRQVMAVNLDSAFTVSREAISVLRDHGRVVFVSSIAGQNGGSVGSGAYAAAKAGLFGLTRALSKELAPRQITVNAVAPGLILDTPFHETFSPPEKQRATIEGIPLGRPGYPADVAGPVLWLCSTASAFVTGTIVDINGGSHFS